LKNKFKNTRSGISGLNKRCTGAGVSEWTPTGVLTIFENSSGAGVVLLRKGRSRSQFFNKRLLCLLLIIIIADCFLQSML